MKYYSAKKKKFKPGEMIVTENSECDGMYIVDSGRVRVFKTVKVDSSVSEVELCILGVKAMFGEMSMLDNSPRSASVQAVEATECTVITRAIFEDQLTRIPPWMVNMIRILVKRLRETNDKLRATVEQYTSAPNDDAGSMIMVEGDKLTPLMNEIRQDIPVDRSAPATSSAPDQKSVFPPKKNAMVVMNSPPPP